MAKGAAVMTIDVSGSGDVHELKKALAGVYRHEPTLSHPFAAAYLVSTMKMIAAMVAIVWSIVRKRRGTFETAS